MAQFYDAIEQYRVDNNIDLKDYEWREFIVSYSVALLWCCLDYSEDENEETRHFDENGYSIHDIDNSLLQIICNNCNDLLKACFDDAIQFAKDYDFDQLGHSLFMQHGLTGCGFYDFSNCESADNINTYFEENCRYRYESINERYSHNGKVF